MNPTQTRIAVLAAALALPTGIAAVSIASAQNPTHAVTSTPAAHVTAKAPTAPSNADRDAEEHAGPDRDRVQAGPGHVDHDGETADGTEKGDTPEPNDKPDAPESR